MVAWQEWVSLSERLGLDLAPLLTSCEALSRIQLRAKVPASIILTKKYISIFLYGCYPWCLGLKVGGVVYINPQLWSFYFSLIKITSHITMVPNLLGEEKTTVLITSLPSGGSFKCLDYFVILWTLTAPAPALPWNCVYVRSLSLVCL